jgi:PPOX class probable F420-dependent enzyme
VNEREALSRLRDARVARLATADATSHPHVVPFVFALEGETLYWAVDEKPKRSRDLKRLANIRENPRVEVLVDGYEEDWTRLWWVRAAGTARILEPGPEWDRAVSALADKYKQYAGSHPGGPVVAIAIERVSGWQANQPN